MPKPPLPSLQFDSPSRSTDPERAKLVAVQAAAPELPPPSAGQGSAPVAAPPPATKAARAQPRKLTVYLSEEAAQAIDDEAYARRKAGERGFGFADMHRELVEEWVARRTKRLRSA